MDDLISKKWLIECVEEGWIQFETEKDENKFIHLVRDIAPSVQLEIIRCKDCKHHWTHRCMDSMPTEICELDQTFYDANVDFCSLAERRTDE